MDYDPSNTDILNAAGMSSSNGVACTDLIFPHLPYDTRATEDYDRQESPLKLVTSYSSLYFIFPLMTCIHTVLIELWHLNSLFSILSLVAHIMLLFVLQIAPKSDTCDLMTNCFITHCPSC